MLSFGCTSVRQSVQQKAEQKTFITERWLTARHMETTSAKTKLSGLEGKIAALMDTIMPK